jgi:uncharacterized protein (TIGR03790 family)
MIDRIKGNETSASVDSELSMLHFDNYELTKWQPNNLKKMLPFWDFKTLMVSRLDGPDPSIAIALIDKAISAETKGLNGNIYIDAGYSKAKEENSLYHVFDKSLLELATLSENKTKMKVKVEKTEKLFSSGQCPQAAIYCGWYSVKKYIDAFDFVDGAIGYHISSFEAVDLRNPKSSQWCPAMLQDGITATIGSVAEPYLHTFPKPKPFFEQLFDGKCLVEAFYRTNPFNSWQLILIGDPLYTPFKIKSPSL